LEGHFAVMPALSAPPARILDAGCGSGSMVRLLAAKYPDARVVGVDIRPEYVTYARGCAEAEGLGNLVFEQGDIFRLPFPDASFDLVWSKYVLQWVKDPAAAVTELRRVTAPGGTVLGCHFDGFAVTHWPEDPTLQAAVERVFPVLVDPFIGRKMASLFALAGLVDLAAHFEPEQLYTNCLIC
jgi:ubiquinone/menaquinone biosynthesis C-methylase UbiE